MFDALFFIKFALHLLLLL